MNATSPIEGSRSTPGAEAEKSPASTTPGLRRRLAAMLYEGVLLFGVVMVFALPYSVLTQQHHALIGRNGLQAFMFVVLGIYFIGFWSKAGQTLAMKTWQLQLQTLTGERLSPLRALVRYLLSWLWFIPALLLARLAGWHSSGEVFGALAVGVLVYASLSWWMPQRQFLHDRLCGTRLLHLPRKPKPR